MHDSPTLAKQAPCVLVMGVCGVGKSSVARLVATRLGGLVVEGDDFHTVESKALMAKGEALTDAMRRPWLAAIAEDAHSKAQFGRPVAIACSALKRDYRDLLRARLPRLIVIHLTGDADLIRERMTKRSDHFMPPAMLESQLSELEVPSAREAVAIDIAMTPEAIVDRIIEIVGPELANDVDAPSRAAR